MKEREIHMDFYGIFLKFIFCLQKSRYLSRWSFKNGIKSAFSKRSHILSFKTVDYAISATSMSV